MSRYASHEWDPRGESYSYTGGPKKLVLHRTEGRTVAAAQGAYDAKKIAPHFTWDIAARRRLQHVDTDRAAGALRNESGGPQTNRDGAVQVEIVGFSKDSPDLSDDELAWLAEGIREICDREGINRRRFPMFVGPEAGWIARPDAPQRMSYSEWENFDGVCGHQHVPENSHWDPGALPYDRILKLMEDPDMPLDNDDLAKIANKVRTIVREELAADNDSDWVLVKGDQRPEWYAVGPPGKRHITSRDEANHLIFTGELRAKPGNLPAVWEQDVVDRIKTL